MALLQIDLDRFKVLNDSLGIEVADQVLRQISGRLSQLLPEAHTVARLGGNEFAVILDNGATTATLARLCALILTRIRLPIEELVKNSLLAHQLVSAYCLTTLANRQV